METLLSRLMKPFVSTGNTIMQTDRNPEKLFQDDPKQCSVYMWAVMDVFWTTKELKNQLFS